jgi:16S rRNA U516 pseudouridylate synthase RsuA-like enzyme
MVSRAAACQWIAEDWVEIDESCPGEPQVRYKQNAISYK